MVCIDGIVSFLELYVRVEDRQSETVHQICLSCAAASESYVM